MEQAIQFTLARELANPIGRDGFHAVSDTGQAASDTAGRVGIAAKIDGFENALLKIYRRQQTPEAGVQRV